MSFPPTLSLLSYPLLNTLSSFPGALVKTESVRHLQTIHDVCEIAANFQQDEER